MDWNKTKTIFIIVFSILNVFLYSLYLDKYTEAKNVKPLGESTVEERLEEDGITYSNLSDEVEEIPYAVGAVKRFTLLDFAEIAGQTVELAEGNLISVSLDKPVSLSSTVSREILESFAETYVFEGDQYALWEIDLESSSAVFFQSINEKPLYYSDKGKLIIHWNDQNEVTGYEQSMFQEVSSTEQKKKILTAVQAVHSLYQKGSLLPETEIESAELGYSTLVQVDEDLHMFTPTWRLNARLPDGTFVDYFVNAVEGTVLELPREEKSAEQQ